MGALTTFENIPQKISSTISSWKFSNLNQAGKILLINSILVTRASHIMATFQLPKFILNKVSPILLKFWWATSHNRKPIYWRKKELLQEHKSKGGLGLKDMEALNQALLFKQAWRIQSNQSLLVSEIFKAIYANDWLRKGLRGSWPKNSTLEAEVS